MIPLPPLAELIDSAVVVSLPMRTRFRGITSREMLLFEGPEGWGEFGSFPEYSDPESAWWLAAGLESAYLGPPEPLRDRVPVNATVPAVDADRVDEILARYPGVHTAKVKVAEPGQNLAQDVARVEAVRARIPNVRVDANGNWTVTEAITALRALGELQYAEQPCRTIDELAEVRAHVTTPIAADESIRKADDPMRVVRAGAADVAVLKVAPLGGMRRILALAEQIAIPIVVSSALDSAIGIGAGVSAAAALPQDPLACGLGTGSMFTADVAEPFLPDGGMLFPRAVTVAAEPPLIEPTGRQWWLDRLGRCYRLLEEGHPAIRLP